MGIAPPSASPSASSSISAGFLLAIALLALIAAQKVVLVDTIDPDAFWHLRVAEQVARDGPRPIVDEISYMSSREPWTPYSWLAELGMRAICRDRLLRPAMLAHIVIAMSLVFVSALACRDASTSRDRAIPILVSVLLSGMWTQWFVAFRPVSAAFVLLAICAWLLLRDRTLDQRSRAVWIVPAIVALCVNVHFFATFVPAWIGALLVGALIERDHRGARRYALLLAASSLALLATPMLPGMLRSIRTFAAADPMVASGTIVEMTYIWRNTWGIILATLAVASLAWLIVRRKEIHAGEWIWLIAMTILATRYARFTPLFAMIAAPLIARTLPAIDARVLRLRAVQAMLALLIVVTAYRVVAAFPARDIPDSYLLATRTNGRFGYPALAADFVEQNIPPRGHKLINGFNWGSYLAWRLPQFKVMADARTQLYPPEFWNRFFFCDADTTRDALRELIATQSPDAAILPRDDHHFRPRLLELGWVIVHEDDRAVVMRAAPALQP